MTGAEFDQIYRTNADTELDRSAQEYRYLDERLRVLSTNREEAYATLARLERRIREMEHLRADALAHLTQVACRAGGCALDLTGAADALHVPEDAETVVNPRGTITFRGEQDTH